MIGGYKVADDGEEEPNERGIVMCRERGRNVGLSLVKEGHDAEK